MILAPQLVDTRRGAARLHLTGDVHLPRGIVLLGHGAGGDCSAPVLLAVTDALVGAGLLVVRFDQPYRVAGRRAPAPARHLDEAAYDVVTHLRSTSGDAPMVLGGKSSGARVACRIAAQAGAAGVVALGFPLRPPGRPERSRAAELSGAGCPVLVCQGERDAFGTPADLDVAMRGLPGAVHAVASGDHSFVARRSDGRTTAQNLAEVTEVVVAWVLDQTAAT